MADARQNHLILRRGCGMRREADPPLADAAARLRGKPGRPQKTRPGAPLDAQPSSGAARGDPGAGTLPVRSTEPRLLDLAGAAGYLSVSPWTIRDLVANGTLCRVRVPLPNGGELRKVLIDRKDLDALIECWKEPREGG